MDDLIYDAYSIFFQILQHFAPEHVADSEFLLAGYIFSCIFVLLVVCAIMYAFLGFARAVLVWFYRR